ESNQKLEAIFDISLSKLGEYQDRLTNELNYII
nr:Rrf2 family transcriptional regulator [Sulfurospirillum sp.]